MVDRTGIGRTSKNNKTFRCCGTAFWSDEKRESRGDLRFSFFLGSKVSFSFLSFLRLPLTDPQDLQLFRLTSDLVQRFNKPQTELESFRRRSFVSQAPCPSYPSALLNSYTTTFLVKPCYNSFAHAFSPATRFPFPPILPALPQPSLPHTGDFKPLYDQTRLWTHSNPGRFLSIFAPP